MYDRVIRGGTVVDGSGGAPFVADVAIDGDRIVAVGENLGAGSENIDASGKIVTPGVVDVQTHYDGQATWDGEMAPSSCHGVTTVVDRKSVVKGKSVSVRVGVEGRRISKKIKEQ